MANDLTNVIPQILAQGLMALRGATIMPRLVNTDYANEARAKGDTIDVPIPSAITAVQVAPNNTAPATADIAPTKVQIPLDQWWEAPFYLTDKDMAESIRGAIPMQVSEAVKSLGNKVNASLFGLYAGVYGFTGTAGTTPFGTANDISDSTNLRKVLNTQLAPLSPRRAVLDPDAEANALGQRAFQDASWRADAQGLIEGQIGRKMGFDWFMDQSVPTHTAGTLSGVTVSGAHAVGAKSIAVATAATTGSVALKKGDIVTFAGDSQTYAIAADATVGAGATGTITLVNGLALAKSGGEAVSVKASHVTNLGFHRDAFALAVRPLEAEGNGLGNIIQSAVDPVSGLALRLEVSREHKRTRWSFDILYGVKLVRPELAARLAG
jgi:hypothetical protein